MKNPPLVRNAVPGGDSTDLATDPGVGVAGVGGIGRIRVGLPAVHHHAEIGHVCIEEGT